MAFKPKHVQKNKVLMGKIIETDKEISRAIYRGTSKHWRKYWLACKVLELSGNGFVWLIAGLLGFRYDTDNMIFWVNLYVTLLLDLVVVGSLKGLFRRERPRYNAGDMVTISVDKYSFPSGHAMRACAVACLCNASEGLGEDVMVVVWTWLACVALSRVVMDVVSMRAGILSPSVVLF